MANVVIEADDMRYAFHDHLRPGDMPTASVLAHAAISRPNEDASNNDAEHQMRVLVVVVNNHGTESYEEGSILVYKPRIVSEDAEEGIDVSLAWAAPLDAQLDISVAQSRKGSDTIDLRPGGYKTTAPPQMVLTLAYDGEKQSFVVSSTEELRTFISEYRRLKEVHRTAEYEDFSWVNFYTSRCMLRREMPQLFPRPDLRELQKPAFSRLSGASAGQFRDEDFDIRCIRDEWIRAGLKQEEIKYSKPHIVKIRVGTFNVNGKLPSQDLSPWIRPQHRLGTALPPLKPVSPLSMSTLEANNNPFDIERDEDTEEESDDYLNDQGNQVDPDLIVLGFQELDLSTEALLYSYTTTREDAWVEAILASLGEVRDQYTKLASKQLVGMLIIILTKKELSQHVSGIQTCAVGTGIMGMMGNKGAAAVQMTVYSTVLSFVNAHLAAFDEYVDRRNADFHDLCRRLVFKAHAGALSGSPMVVHRSADESLVYSNSSRNENESAFQADVLFWLGDLNYRIDLPDEDVRELISGRPWTYSLRDMLEHDQLTKSRRDGRAFEGFREGPIRFSPTYRFKLGIDIETDALDYDMKRRPAWTDRILHISDPDIHVKQLSYESHTEITMSDHRPVSAAFSVPARSIDRDAFNREAAALFSKLVKLEDAEEVPKLRIGAPEVDFGQVWYKKRCSQKLRIENVGKVAAAFRFIPINEEDPVVPSWLTISPQMGIILPNEHIDLTLTIFVDNAAATHLNLDAESLQYTLILHTIWGKDHFIVISGKYQSTCFANDVETLVRLPGPIRSVDSGRLLSKEPRANAPNEVIRLINWLMANAIDVPDMYISRGSRKLVDFIRECLDTGHEFMFGTSEEKHTICLSFGQALLQFFVALPTSLVPPHLHQRCMRAKDRDEAFEIISELPGHSLNVWISLTAYLHYHVQQQRSNDIDAIKGSIACIFAPILMRDNAKIAPPVSPLAKRKFLTYFLH